MCMHRYVHLYILTCNTHVYTQTYKQIKLYTLKKKSIAGSCPLRSSQLDWGMCYSFLKQVSLTLIMPMLKTIPWSLLDKFQVGFIKKEEQCYSSFKYYQDSLLVLEERHEYCSSSSTFLTNQQGWINLQFVLPTFFFWDPCLTYTKPTVLVAHQLSI